jgi:hypothetical protein
MEPEYLYEKLHAQPFEPFVVIMNNGRKYEVMHPEFALLTSETLYLTSPQPGRRVPSGPPVMLASFNISSLEPLAQEAEH